MKNENACCFELLGKFMTVETNDFGSCLRVTWDDIVIEDSFGECFTWPENLCLLHGAARQSSMDKALRAEGEASLRQYIQTAFCGIKEDDSAEDLRLTVAEGEALLGKFMTTELEVRQLKAALSDCLEFCRGAAT